MATPQQPALPPPIEIIDMLSDETIAGFAEMDRSDLNTCKRMLRRGGLSALVAVLDILHPEAQA